MTVAARTHLARAGHLKQETHQSNWSWNHLRSIFQDSPEGICLVDRSMRVAVWNRTATEVTGYPASEVLGRLCAIEGNSFKLDSFSQIK